MTDEQDEAPAESSAEIPAEQAIEQRPIPFMGDDLAAARTAEGAIYVTIPGICRALGLNAQAQYRRIARTPTLAKGLRSIPLDTGRGVKPTYCLRVDRVALWLGGVETLSVKEQYRAKIEAYQDELAPVAMQVFMRSLGVQPAPVTSSTMPAGMAVTSAEIAEIRGQIADLYGVANLLQEHLAALLALPDQMGQALSMLEALSERQDTAEGQLARIDERTQRLTPAHARALQEQINRMVYDTRHLAPPKQPLTYPIIYGRLKQRFRASTYREIADERYAAVMEYLQDELRRALAGEGPAQGSLF